MTHQQRKDYLWALDEQAEHATSLISQETGEAWKALVEHNNYHKHLLRAQELALELGSKIGVALTILKSGTHE